MKKKNVTINDIAKEVGVSKNTISRYLNGKFQYMSKETKERIEKVIEEMNYNPSNIARSLSTSKSNMLGICLSDIENPFSAATIKGINEACMQTKYNVIIGNSNNDVEIEKRIINSFLEQRVDAILVNPVNVNAPHILLASKTTPIILLDRDINGKTLDLVGANNEIGVNRVIDHLHEEGYTNIHLFTEYFLDMSPRLERVEFFKNKLQQFGYKNIEDYIHVIDIEDKENVESEIKKVVEMGGSSAIFASNGPTLLKTALKIKRMKIKVPKEIAIAGYDDFGSISRFGWAELSYKEITTIAPNWYQLGKIAVNIAINRIDNPESPIRREVIDMGFDIRESTKRQL